MSSCKYNNNSFSSNDSSTSLSSNDEYNSNYIKNYSKQTIIIEAISTTLSNIIQDNHKYPYYKSIIKNQRSSPFHSNNHINISISNLLNRVIKHCQIETSTLVTAIIYLDKIISEHLFLTKYNVFYLLIASLLLAIKINEDVIYTNKTYAKLFGVSLHKLNELEYVLLKMMNYKLTVKTQEYEMFYNELIRFHEI